MRRDDHVEQEVSDESTTKASDTVLDGDTGDDTAMDVDVYNDAVVTEQATTLTPVPQDTLDATTAGG